MPKKKKKLNKAERREVRLRKARQWVLTYEGSHIVRAYRKRFKVDPTCAHNDLEAIGALEPERLAAMRKAEQLRLEQRRKEREERRIQESYDRFPDSDDTFFFIAGHTSGGAPYGVTWEQMGLRPYQDLEDADWDEDENEDDILRFREQMVMMRRNAIWLNVEGDSPGTVGCTKFGGIPDVPPDFVWPVFETNTFDDEEVKPRPLAFLAQFNCAELKRRDKDRLLPSTGLLSFFYEMGSQRWGFDPKDKGCARVFWFPDTEELSPAVVPEDLEEGYRFPAINITMGKEKSYPDYSDFACKAENDKEEGTLSFDEFTMLQAELGIEEETEPCSRLLGWPLTIQGNMTAECELVSRGYCMGGGDGGAPKAVIEDAMRNSLEDWQLLLQLDTVEQDDFELMFGDCGRIYFYIRKDDLKARRFENVWLILQCF